jgi:hypothetical protein
MRAIILAALGATSAQADMIARHGADSVRLTGEACPESIALPDGADRRAFRKAVAVVGGERYTACHALRVDGLVVLIYQDGDAGLIPVVQFRMVPDT